jgi:hypothetical protein
MRFICVFELSGGSAFAPPQAVISPALRASRSPLSEVNRLADELPPTRLAAAPGLLIPRDFGDR